jgi:SAM-dependent methyltransferase
VAEPDPHFAHPRLAAIYDAFEGDRDDLAFYLGVAEELGADRVLDVGCGTGSLAVLLAESGRTVMGADPAGASLEIAKSKDQTGRITWIHGDATAVPSRSADLPGADLPGADLPGADLAVMTGNVAQVILADEDWTRTLHAIGAALHPRGYLVFETRRPEHRTWEEWAAEVAPVILDIPGVGPVERRREVTGVSYPLVHLRDTYRFLTDGTAVTSESTRRFRSRDEVAASLAACGYQVLDVRDAPDRPGREFVFIAQRTGGTRLPLPAAPDRRSARCIRPGG